MDNNFLFYLLDGDDFLWITPFTSTNRVEDVLSDDVSEWACGSSRHFAPSNHHAHCCHPHAHSEELARPRVSVWFDRVQTGQWHLNRSKCFWSKIPGKKKNKLSEYYRLLELTVVEKKNIKQEVKSSFVISRLAQVVKCHVVRYLFIKNSWYFTFYNIFTSTKSYRIYFKHILKHDYCVHLIQHIQGVKTTWYHFLLDSCTTLYFYIH